MNRKAQERVLTFLQIRFRLKKLEGFEGKNFILIHLKSKSNSEGMLETHCVVLYKANGYVYKNAGTPPMPTFLFSLIKFCRVEDYIEEINALKFYLIFKFPITEKDLASLPDKLPTH